MVEMVSYGVIFLWFSLFTLWIKLASFVLAQSLILFSFSLFFSISTFSLYILTPIVSCFASLFIDNDEAPKTFIGE